MSNRPRLGSSGRIKTPARPLYAARLPPIQHPLGAPNSPRPEDSPDEASQSEPVIKTTSMGQTKIRPTTARPIGTQLSAKTSMAGSMSGGLKPLPAIGEPYRKPSSRARNAKSSPVRLALKCLVICMFLSIPVLIFIVMMVLSGGFAPTTENEVVPSNGTINMPGAPIDSNILSSPQNATLQPSILTSITTLRPVIQNATTT